jgi:hypothetical protein
VGESLHVRLILRAAEIMGGVAPLAQHLGVALSDVQSWAGSAVPLPPWAFEKLVDIISDEALREVAQYGIPSARGGPRSADP